MIIVGINVRFVPEADMLNFAMDVAACPIKPDVVLSQLANITQDLGTLSCRARNQVMRGLLSP